MNPFDGVAKFFLGMLEQRTLQNWGKLLFELLVSAALSLSYTFGVSIAACAALWAAGKPMTPGWALVISLGAGSTAAAVSVTKLIRQDQAKLLRGLTFVLPSAEAADEIQANLQTIIKAEK